MSGLLRRIRRPGAAEETRTEATTPAPAHGSAPETPATSEDGQRLPAGIAPEDLERRGATGRRSRLRRRARFLRRARELALRDLGGLVYEARRREQDGGKLVEEKVARLAALDSELGGIEAALGMPRGQTVIRQPGVGGTCARCGELHSSDARFCSHCGVNLEEAAAEKARAEEAARAEAAKAEAEKAEAERAEAEKAAAAKAEAAKADAEKTEAASKESSDGAGNGRPAVKADEGSAANADAPTTEQPATPDAPTTEQPATEAAAPDAPTTEQPPADEPATKPLA